jgi:3-dehydroquinate synthase II/3-amino-4-hydroxybenzoic acid synthase
MIWFDGRNLQEKEKILPLVYNYRFEYLLVKKDMYEGLKAPRKIKLAVEVENIADIKMFPKEIIIFSEQVEVLKKAKKQGFRTALYRRIEQKENLESAWKDGMRENFLVVELTSDTNIPLELLIARLQPVETVLLKQVTTFADAEVAFGVMEAGSDGIVVKSEDIGEIGKFDKFMAKEEIGKVELVKAKVVDVEHVGMGFRSCIDSTDIMKKNEGMIIGSTSNGGLLISSETHFLPYMELRPFRVNAGAVHSYVWAPGNMTSYITELKAGKRVLCVDTEGNTREVVVGRSKIEKRPLLKIEVEAGGVSINAIVQDDWHIRIFGGKGEPMNASTIKKGDELLAYVSPGARHVGIKIDEFIEEK